jgi:hypothetical protein
MKWTIAYIWMVPSITIEPQIHVTKVDYKSGHLGGYAPILCSYLKKLELP